MAKTEDEKRDKDESSQIAMEYLKLLNKVEKFCRKQLGFRILVEISRIILSVSTYIKLDECNQWKIWQYVKTLLQTTKYWVVATCDIFVQLKLNKIKWGNERG